MEVRPRAAQFLKDSIEKWHQDGLLSNEQVRHLQLSIKVMPFDWHRFAIISFWVAVVCFIIAISTLLADNALTKLISIWVGQPDVVKCMFVSVLSAIFYFIGFRYRRTHPKLHYTSDAVLFLGIVTTAIALFYLGLSIDVDPKHFSSLILVSYLIYGALAIYFSSNIIWVFTLLAMGAWYGAETGYQSGWGYYYFGMSYPLRFVVFGSVLTVLSFFCLKHKRFIPFYKSTHIIALLYLFLALWLLSIFGNYGNFNDWAHVKQIQLLHWSLIFALVAVAAIVFGLKYDRPITKGFGITFLFINLYTRAFEYYWDSTHKAIFFALLGLSLWYVGTKAERIWSMKLSLKT